VVVVVCVWGGMNVCMAVAYDYMPARGLGVGGACRKKDNAWRGKVLRGPSPMPQLGKVTMAAIVSVTLQAVGTPSCNVWQ